MTETREQRIERLKNNEWVVIGGMDKEDIDVLESLRRRECLQRKHYHNSNGFTWQGYNITRLIPTAIYRIAPDYKEEPEWLYECAGEQHTSINGTQARIRATLWLSKEKLVKYSEKMKVSEIPNGRKMHPDTFEVVQQEDA